MTHRIDRRSVVAGLGAATLAPGLAGAQQDWPRGRQLRLMVPFPPGGATDVVGRITVDRLGQV